jgi:tetratricopeptide (TPR) repeat protein
MGDTVNLAARLMQAAGEAILCDAATREASESAVGFGAARTIRVKGKAEPVVVHEPFSRATARRRQQAVGRTRERARLADALDALLRGESRAVLLEGLAGMGKSRLVGELVERAEARGVLCLAGAADPIDHSTPYFAWRPVFARLLGLHALEPDDQDGRRARLRACMAADPVVARLAPLLREVAGVDIPETPLTAAMTGEVRAHNTEDLLVHLLRRAVAEGPVALVLEDGHWFDSASWALLRQVPGNVAPLLLVLSSRPLPAPLPRVYARLRADRVELAALSPDETRELLEACLDEPPADALTDAVHARAEGHPFFTEALALALRDAGELEVRGGATHLRAAGGAAALSLPDTVQGAVLARIDRLDPRLQLLLKVASVIGRRFAVDLLAAIHPVERDRASVGAALDAMERMDLTVREPAEPASTWLYRHETTREVAYDLLLFSQRRQLHRAVAERLEAQPPERRVRLYARLAWHWSRAEVPDKTLHYLEKSAEHALLNGAYAEARAALAQALGHREGVPERRRAHWERLLGEALLGLGQLPESRAAFERAAALLGFPVPRGRAALGASLLVNVGRQATARLARRPTLRDVEPETFTEAARAYLRLLETCFFLADPPETLDASLRALNIAEAVGPSPELARACALTGWIVSMVPQFRLSDVYLRMAGRLVETEAGRPALQPVRFFTGFSRLARGQWAEGRAALEEAVRLAEAIGDKRRWIESVCGLSTLLHYRGEYAERVRMGADVLYTSARRQGDLQAEAWGLLDQIESLLPLGEIERAAPLLEKLAPFLEADIGRSEQVWGHGLTAAALLERGRHDDAYAAARRANAASAGLAPVAVYTFEGYAGAAEVLLALAGEAGAPAGAREHARAACAALDRYARVFPIARPRALLCRGLLHDLTGHRGRARADLRRSLAAARALGMPFEEARAHAALGRAATSAGERRRHLDAAALLFGRLGAKRHAARILNVSAP